jgi:hypothetical protein
VSDREAFGNPHSECERPSEDDELPSTSQLWKERRCEGRSNEGVILLDEGGTFEKAAQEVADESTRWRFALAWMAFMGVVFARRLLKQGVVGRKGKSLECSCIAVIGYKILRIMSDGMDGRSGHYRTG